jgi:hypothetical protein
VQIVYKAIDNLRRLIRSTFMQKNVRKGIIVPLPVVFLCVACPFQILLAQEGEAVGGQAQQASGLSEDDAKEISQKIKQLSSDSFSSREIAKARLVEIGEKVIPALEKSLDKADTDLSTQVFEVFGKFALDAQSSETQQIVQILKRLSRSEATFTGKQSKQLLESIRELHSPRAAEELGSLGARIVVGSYPLNGRNGFEQIRYLEINERFSGNADDLVWLQWLNQVEMVVLQSEKIKGEWLKYLQDMPALELLVIRDADINSNDLNWLKGIERLEHLEILYTPIDDKSAEILASLSVWTSMRIFGTNISLAEGESLGKKLDGIEYQFGCGGFLGIQSDAAAARSSTVGRVTPGGAAELAGIIEGDTIVKIDDTPIESFDDIRANLRKYRPADKIMVELNRADATGRMEKIQVEVVLGRQSI